MAGIVQTLLESWLMGVKYTSERDKEVQYITSYFGTEQLPMAIRAKIDKNLPLSALLSTAQEKQDTTAGFALAIKSSCRRYCTRRQGHASEDEKHKDRV